MNTGEISLSPAEKTAVHWPSALQFGLGAAAAGLMFAGALGLAVSGLFSAASGGSGEQTLSMLLMAASFLGIGLLLFPSIYYGFMRLTGRPAIDSKPWLLRMRPGMWMLLFLVVVTVGAAASRLPMLSWIVLPALHVLALGLPIGWMVYLVGRGLPWGTSQRFWGVFSSGLVLGPALISILEILAVIAVAAGALVYVASQPALVEELMALAQSLQGGEPSPDDLMAQFGPYLMRPEVIFGVMALSAGLVPLIEEALKPIGVWLLVGRPISPAAGLAAGALSGAGFALTESLLLSSGGLGWPLLVLVRMGTGAIHILNSGLTGWALASAWKGRRFGTLAAAYLVAVLIHALWNGLTVATVFSEMAQAPGMPPAPPLISNLAVAAPPVLFLLAGGSLFLLYFFNRQVRKVLAKRQVNDKLGTTSNLTEDPAQ